MDSTIASPTDVSPPAPQFLVNASNQEIKALLDEQNLLYFSSLRPSVGYLLGLAVCGLLGNTLVFVVYFLKLKTFPMRTYILAMSVCDLMTNCYSLPVEVVEIRTRFTFPSVGFCSLSWAIMCFLLLFSGAVLVAVAFDRHKLVCRQNSGHRSGLHREKKFLLLGFLVSFVASLPLLGVLELQAVAIPGTDLTGTICTFVKGSALVPVMNYIFNGLFVSGFVIICYSYGRIAGHLWQHRRQKNNGITLVRTATTTAAGTKSLQTESSVEAGETETSQKMDSSEPDPEEETAVQGTVQVFTTSSFSEGLNADAPTVDGINTCTEEETSPHPRTNFSLCFSSYKCPKMCYPIKIDREKKGKAMKGRGSQKRISHRLTLMLFVLTVIFCLNYVPYMVMVLLRNARSEEHLIQTLGHNVYYILVRSLYINSAINPFVYGISSPRFRRETVRLFRCRT